MAAMPLFVVEEFSPIPALLNQVGYSTVEKLQIKASGLNLVFKKVEWLSSYWRALNGAENQVLYPLCPLPIHSHAKDSYRFPAPSYPSVAPWIAVYGRLSLWENSKSNWEARPPGPPRIDALHR